MIASDLERDNVDTEIAVLEERIRALKAKRNTLAPISMLPNELLCRILMECRGEWPQFDEEDRVTWLVVTQVCHAWRTAALGYPQLWSAIDADLGYHWMETFFHRSKDATLSLRISQEWDEQYLGEKRKILARILREHLRLGKVIMDMRGDELHASMKDLTERMPRLTHFALHNLTSDGLALPSPLLGNHAPRLRILSLDNFDPPWTSPILEGLMSLSLLNTDVYCEIPTPSSNTFFHSLGQIHGLQHLTIENTLPDPKPLDPPITALKFASLESLKLQGTCEQCSWVIRHTRIPPSATVALDVFDVDEANLAELLEVVSSSWKGGPLSRMPDGATGESQCDRMSLSGDSSGISIGDGSSTRFSLAFIGQEWNSSLQTTVMDGIPLQGITSLSIIHSSLKSAILKVTLPRLASLTRLVILGSPVSIFRVLLEDLAAEDLGPSVPSSPTIYLPRLTTLNIGNIRFISDSDTNSKAYGLPLRSLRRWLSFRHASGAGIQRLEIFDCSKVSTSVVSKLQHCIGDDGRVVWDGKVRG